jgi:proteasome lid subunit RPN8/RPN11
MTLVLSPEQDQTLRAHAVREYPGECCGVLIGEVIGLTHYISLVVPFGNRHEDGPDRRYRISADDLLLAEKIARKHKQSVVGIYHSHPDVPAVPSAYDQQHAWETYSYLIVEVVNGEAICTRSWKLDLDAGRFNEENVLVNPCILDVAAKSAMSKP